MSPSAPLSAAATTAPLAPSPSETFQRTRIAKSAQDFEASFLSVMINQMFSAVDSSGPFTGGSGEAAFRSFLGDAVAQQIVRSGGIGLAGPVQAQMLKLQGLS
jgi:Rod binding domain-containing protein